MIWVLSAALALIVAVVNLFDGSFDMVMGTIGGFFGWAIFLIIVQYLIFAKLDPRCLFDGILNNK